MDYHITHDVCGVKAVSAVIGDNASTQSGATKGHAVELRKLFAVSMRTVFVGSYHHVLNIALRNSMGEGLGVGGTMLGFNLFQLHHKVGYVHHTKPSYYKALDVSEGIFP